MSFFSDEQIEIMNSKTVRADFLIRMDFVSETKYLWNGNYKLPINGKIYEPLYGIAQIENLSGLTNQESAAVTLKVAGLPNKEPDILSKVLSENFEVDQRTCIIYMQFFDPDFQPVGNPIPLFFGFMQKPKIDRTPMTPTEGSVQTITLDVENMFFNRSKAPYGRLSDRDQQKRHPEDKMLQFASTLLYRVFTYPDYS